MTKKKKIVFKSLLILLGALVVFLFFLPTLIKNYAIKNGKELAGREISIENLKYNYFSSTLQVYNFKIFEQNGTDEFSHFDTLILNLATLKLFKDKIEIEQLYIKGLTTRLVMKDSTFNFDDLIAFHLASEDTIQTVPENTEPLKYSISNLELKDSNIYFDNKNVNKETHLEDFSFLIPYIGWDQEQKSNADIRFNFKNGGYFQSILNINPIDGEYDAVVTLNKLNLEPFYEYVLEYANINSFKGILNSEIEIQGNTNQPTKAIVSGRVNVDDFLMTDTNNKDVLSSKKIDCKLEKIDYANSSYVIDSLNFRQPYAYFEMDSITNNLFKLFKLYPEGNSVDNNSEIIDTTSTSNMYYAINHLKIDQGILDYTDNLTGEKFDYHLSDIQINSDAIKSNSEWIDIYSTMLLNNRGTLNAKLGFNPENPLYTNLDLTIENFLLTDINIYANYYTGHNIIKGDFYYYSKSIITNGDIESENKLLIKNVSVTNNKSGIRSLPLKFALFLLKDKNGDVNLDVPVRGDLNDPEINVKKIVWNTFKNLIVKTVASPVNFLAGLVDGNPKEFEELSFSYLDTMPSEKQFRKLDKLLEMETKKEGLKIELTHYVDINLQKEAIAFSELGKQFFNDTKKDYLKDDKEFETYLKTKAENDSLSKTEAAFKLINQNTLDSLATSFNQSLIKNTENYLKTTKESTQISVLKSEVKDPDNIGSISRFKIKYDMLEPENNQN
tara:strand:+ start:38343 stop:40520 length:2178 start_codon:yes stop_codon:yes gene_type:complete